MQPFAGQFGCGAVPGWGELSAFPPVVVCGGGVRSRFGAVRVFVRVAARDSVTLRTNRGHREGKTKARKRKRKGKERKYWKGERRKIRRENESK